jgi:branched-chain amino acid transport system substrate-binding protein
MKTTIFVYCVLGVALGIVACGKSGGGGNPNVIKIVSSLPRTGSANAQTTTIVNGIRLAIDEVGGKAGNFTIDYADWDDASPQRGTYNSGAAKISIPKLNQAGLVMLSPANTYPGLTKPGTGEANEPAIYRPSGKINYYRVVPADDLQGAVAADWAKALGVTKVFVTHDRELYGKGIADIFKKHAEENGLTVTGYEGIDVRASNYKALVTKIKASGADLVYFGGTTQSNGGQLAKDLRSGGFEGKLMVPDGCVEKAFIEAAGAENLNDRAYATFGGLPAKEMTGKGAEFVQKYEARFHSEPEVYAIYGYECAKVALDAIARAGKKDRAAILDAVSQTKDFQGGLGTWSFDENGDTTLRVMSGQIVRNGAFEFVARLGT